MKTNFLKIAALLIFAVVFYACNDEQIKPDDSKNTVTTEQIVTTRGRLDKMMIMLGAALRENQGNSDDNSGGRISQRFLSKSEAARLAEDWGGCALFSFTENADGSWTIKLDYGSGCNDGTAFKKGVVTFTGKSTSNTSGYYKVTFENFSETKVGEQTQNPGALTGYYESDWTAEIIPLEDTTDMRRDELIETNLTVKYQNGSKDTFKATSELSSTMEGTTVTSCEFSGTTAKGDVFSGNVVEPLFFSFSCIETYIYVSGSEAVDVNGKSSVIDYGDGACDNIFTITQEGIVVTIDLDEING